jgi:hypothetical protein
VVVCQRTQRDDPLLAALLVGDKRLLSAILTIYRFWQKIKRFLRIITNQVAGFDQVLRIAGLKGITKDAGQLDDLLNG